MIARIEGKVTQRSENFILLDVGGLAYEVWLPRVVMQRIDEHINDAGLLSLITYHYLHIDQSRGMPVLIGFINEIEKEFFEVFITVSGIGPRAALRALNQPISAIARAIDEADIDFLRSLPGIGQQRAREIIAKLQNKIGKFGLIKDAALTTRTDKIKDIEAEALEVLMQLEYKKTEAQAMIRRALENTTDIQNTEELLNEVYKQRRGKNYEPG